MKIAICYIVTGRYTVFWDEFYKSCLQYFITDAQKHFFVFTDSQEIKSSENVTVVPLENPGWPLITVLRYRFINSIRSTLESYDYIFFFNANLQFVRPISATEFLPTPEEGLLAVQHPKMRKGKSVDKIKSYERNPTSQAYVPYGVGKTYYQAAIIGGHRPAFLKLLADCEAMTNIDLANNFIPRAWDESIFNRYILDKPYKELPWLYLYPPKWRKPWWTWNSEIKIIQRNKGHHKYGGHKWLRGVSEKKITWIDYWLDNLFGI